MTEQTQGKKVSLQFPIKLQPLFIPKRYKIIYGGRGGAKSWGIARALLVLAAGRPLRVLCTRELQKSIKDSVHRLLSDQIVEMGLDGFYEIQQASIKGRNGSEFFFESLRYNSSQIKSYEGVDIVWVEEAATVSKSSWEILIPTIRRDKSEIWISFNPELEEDETYQRFILNPPEDSVLIEMNWRDNPWFPEVLRQEKDALKQRDPDAYLNVWEGRCRLTLDGAIYANELRKAQEERRITSVLHDPKFPVCTFWDLGFSDMTSIWFVQKVGMEYRIIDFYQNSQQSITHYVQYLQGKSYVYGTDYLPHDGRARQLGTGKSIEEILTSLGRRVAIVPKLDVSDGINAARLTFPACWFDEKRCADGLQALRRYRYEHNPDTGKISLNPLHDVYSHAADAFRTFAVEPNVQWDVIVERPNIPDTKYSGKLLSEYNPLDAM